MTASPSVAALGANSLDLELAGGYSWYGRTVDLTARSVHREVDRASMTVRVPTFLRLSRFILPQRRHLARLGLLLHLCMWGLVPIADASFERGIPAQAGVHLEPEDNPSCPPAHSHQYCQLCPVLDLRGVPASTLVPVRLASGQAATPIAGDRSDTPASASISSLGPRAPPRTA